MTKASELTLAIAVVAALSGMAYAETIVKTGKTPSGGRLQGHRRENM